MRTIGIRLGVIVVSIVSGLALFAAPASASAVGGVYITPFTLGVPIKGTTVGVPFITGFFGHSIKGKHRLVEKERATYTIAPSAFGYLKGRACSWRIDFEYFNADADNKSYNTDRGVTNRGCPIEATREVRPGTIKHFGRACARLYINGVRRASHCHEIT